jgi:integrase
MTMQKQVSVKHEREMWSHVTGQKGTNRIRVFAWPAKGNSLWIDYREQGKRLKKSLGHSDQDRAIRQAEEIAARLSPENARPAAGAVLTLQTLFDIYEREVTPQKKSGSARGHDKRTLPLFLACFGADRQPASLNVRDWQSFIRRRSSGELAPSYKRDAKGKVVWRPVRARMVEQDLKLLLAVLNWAERARGDGSGYLLDRNPLRGLKLPREESPRRPMFTLEQCVALRRAAQGHSAAAERFVLLAWYTGHRSGAIRQLRWSDIDLEAGTIRWRAEIDKIGYEHRNPLHPDLLALLKRDQVREAAIGDAWVFPNPGDPAKSMSREHAVQDLWPALRDAVGIPKGERYGWHSFRRTFANALRDVPLRELKDLGGWKNQATVVAVYLRPDENAQRSALAKLATGTR